MFLATLPGSTLGLALLASSVIGVISGSNPLAFGSASSLRIAAVFCSLILLSSTWRNASSKSSTLSNEFSKLL